MRGFWWAGRRVQGVVGIGAWSCCGRGLPVESIRAWFSRGTLPGAGSFLKVESFEGLIPRREPRQDVGWSGSGPSWGRGPGEGRALPCPTARSCTRPYPVRTPVVRHYKVKREGAKYVIDVEDPVSTGPVRGRQRRRLRPSHAGPDSVPSLTPVLLHLARSSGQLFRVAHQ